MKRKVVCIDISNVIPGEGGTGGGVATYAINLLYNLDRYFADKRVEIICLKNRKLIGLERFDNIKLIDVDVDKGSFFSRVTWVNFRLPLFCLRNKVDILHRVIPEMPLFKVCAYVCTLHDLMFDFYLNNNRHRKYLSLTEVLKFKYFKTISRFSAKSSNRVIVPSESVKEEAVLKYDLPSSRFTVTYEASILAKPEVVPKVLDNIKIGVIAGFYPHKGHFAVIDLVAKFIAVGFDNFKVCFRGNPLFLNYVSELKLRISELGLSEYIEFVPFTSKVTLAEIYSNLDLLLLLSEYEGFGLPALEAQAHGVPVVCSGIPVFREILGSSAIFVERYDTQSMKELIRTITSKVPSTEFRERSISNANSFSWKKMSYETGQVYTQLLHTDC